MKLIKKEETDNKEFKPFELTLKVESNDEARILWHIFNRLNLVEAIFCGTCGTYGADHTSFEISDLDSLELREEIEKHIIGDF